MLCSSSFWIKLEVHVSKETDVELDLMFWFKQEINEDLNETNVEENFQKKYKGRSIVNDLILKHAHVA